MVNTTTFRFLLYVHASGSDLRLYDGSDLSIDEMVGPDAASVVGPCRGLTVLQYSVVCTVDVES